MRVGLQQKACGQVDPDVRAAVVVAAADDQEVRGSLAQSARAEIQSDSILADVGELAEMDRAGAPADEGQRGADRDPDARANATKKAVGVARRPEGIAVEPDPLVASIEA